MNPLTLLYAAAQAGMLLWGAVNVSNVLLRPNRTTAVLWTLAALAGALGVAHYAPEDDIRRVICTPADCLILVLSVAAVRLFAVGQEERRIAEDYEENQRRRAEAAQAARRAQEEEMARAAAADLDARFAAAEKLATAPIVPPRHLTPSLLRGGAPSPRLPAAPRK
jgi:hypothetical protein